MRRTFWTALIYISILPALANAQEFSLQPGETIEDQKDFSPFVDQHFPNRVYWGDTHLHTSNSPDAGMVGNTLPPEMAYRFARGEEVSSSGGLRVKLVRPLDWLVVSDHSEYMGLAPMLQRGDPVLLEDPVGRQVYEDYRAGGERAYNAFLELVNSVTRGELLIKNPEVMRSVWEDNNEVADRYNDPGHFSAFIGYEWSSLPSGNNLHRVVIFRDGADKASQVVPFSSVDRPAISDTSTRVPLPTVSGATCS